MICTEPDQEIFSPTLRCNECMHLTKYNMLVYASIESVTDTSSQVPVCWWSCCTWHCHSSVRPDWHYHSQTIILTCNRFNPSMMCAALTWDYASRGRSWFQFSYNFIASHFACSRTGGGQVKEEQHIAGNTLYLQRQWFKYCRLCTALSSW